MDLQKHGFVKGGFIKHGFVEISSQTVDLFIFFLSVPLKFFSVIT